MIKRYFVYILHCETGTLYTGYTNDLKKRYQSHINGTGKCKYTHSFKPRSIAQCWQVNGNKSVAMKIEHYIKKLSRVEKEKIITTPSMLSIIYPVKPIS